MAGLGVLLLRGLLQAVPTRRPSADWQPEAQGLEAAVVEGLRGWGCGRELATLFRHLEQPDPRVKQLAGDLQTWSLVLSEGRKRLALWGQALLLAPVLLLGLTRWGAAWPQGDRWATCCWS